MNVQELAKIAFAAYRERVGGKTYDGQELPQWEGLHPGVREGWIAAIKAAKNEIAAHNRAFLNTDQRSA